MDAGGSGDVTWRHRAVSPDHVENLEVAGGEIDV
jgi:hypothetical protein